MKLDRSMLILAVLGSLVFLNVISVKTFGRLDFTRDKQYTLGDGTKDALRRLTDPVTVKAYFSKDMPPPFSTNARYAQDLLEEYYAHAGGFFRYEFIDPMEEETQEDKEKRKEVKRDIFGRTVREATSMESELQRLGIPPVQVQAREEDKIEVKKAYMGMAIKYGENTEVIPVIKETNNLEYDMTTLIRKLTRSKTPKVAFVTARGSANPQEEMGKIYGLLTQLYDVSTIDMSQSAEIGDDIDAIIVVGPKEPFGSAAQGAIDSFVVSGRSAAFLLDTVKPTLATLEAEPADHGLTEMLASYGAKIQNGVALDVECATITVQRQQGFMRIAQPVRYPFMPIAKATDPDHPLTRGMAQVAFPFMAPVEITAAADGPLKTDVLAKTSEKAWLESLPLNLDPFQKWTQDMVGDQKQLNLVVTLAGPVKSHFGAPEALATEGGEDASGPEARLLVAGGSSFLTDQFMSPTNQALALNLIDWLLADDGLLALRSRGLGGAPLEELSDGTRAAVKYGNIVGLPLAFIAFGLLRWRRREAQRQQVKL